MKKSDFNKLLKSIITKNKVDPIKIKLLTSQERSDMVYHIVRYRGPILKELIPEDFDRSWLASMGYLYETKGNVNTFVHTCEQRII